MERILKGHTQTYLQFKYFKIIQKFLQVLLLVPELVGPIDAPYQLYSITFYILTQSILVFPGKVLGYLK